MKLFLILLTAVSLGQKFDLPDPDETQF